jgi:hypothetical protein
MAEGDGTSKVKARQVPLDGETLELVKVFQSRLTPRPNQPETIKLALELAEQHTRHLIPRTNADLRADILGKAS